MKDSLIRCGNGCGRMLSFERLREGARSASGINCEACVSEPIMRRLVAACGITGDDAEAFVRKGVAWVIGEPDPAALPPAGGR